MADKKRVSAHNAIVSEKQIHDSLDAAMLEYQRTLLTPSMDAGSAAAVGLKLKGATEFVDCFLKLGINIAPRAASKVPGLDHNV